MRRARPLLLPCIHDLGPAVGEDGGESEGGERLDDWVVPVGFVFRGTEEVVAVKIERSVINKHAIPPFSV